jgi:hypothetical protein
MISRTHPQGSPNGNVGDKEADNPDGASFLFPLYPISTAVSSSLRDLLSTVWHIYQRLVAPCQLKVYRRKVSIRDIMTFQGKFASPM